MLKQVFLASLLVVTATAIAGTVVAPTPALAHPPNPC
jgi:aconitase A